MSDSLVKTAIEKDTALQEINIQKGTHNTGSPFVMSADKLADAILKSGIDKLESSEEIAARIAKEDAKQKLEMFKSQWSFILTLTMQLIGFGTLIGVLVVSGWIVIDEYSNPNARDFAQKTITGLVGAITGFSIGKNIKS
ncbi:MAG: hypothetical protein AAF810_02445 [Cyanobacteria bacterium P01_D01_bin.36]